MGEIWPTLDQASKSPEPEASGKDGVNESPKKTNWVPMKGIAGATPHRQQAQYQGFVSTRGAGSRRPKSETQQTGAAPALESKAEGEVPTEEAQTDPNARNYKGNRSGLRGNRARGGRGAQRGGMTRPAGTAFVTPPYSSVPLLMTEDTLRDALQQQIEYYFSVENLCKDIYLRQHMDNEGWVSFSFLASFNRVRSLSADIAFLAEVAKQSTQLDVNGECVRTKVDWKNWVIPGNTVAPQPPGPPTGVTGRRCRQQPRSSRRRTPRPCRP